MGEHRQALDIYVFKLKDPGKAEESISLALKTVSYANISSATATTFTSPNRYHLRRQIGLAAFQVWIQTPIPLLSTIPCSGCTSLPHHRTSPSGNPL